MNLIRCRNGHFYDAGQFSECPHCKAAAGNQQAQTAPLDRSAGPTTTSVETTEPVNLQDAVGRAMSKNGYSKQDEQKTVGFYGKTLGKEPVVGWLIAIGGPHYGEDFRLISGRNFIGRGADMDVCLSKDNTVSREKHAIVLFDPKQSVYIVQPGDAKELFYLNNEVVLSPVKIGRNDILALGETKMMFFPCCDENFAWGKEED